MRYKKTVTIIACVVVLFFVVAICIRGNKSSSHNKSVQGGDLRIFKTSFESVDDFKGFYIVPQDYKSAASHDLSVEQVKSGIYAHKGWVYKKNELSTVVTNNNHRGYPTIQLYKTKGGAFKTPVLIEFWVWLDIELVKGEWFSFATFDHTTSDTWDPVLVNLSDEKIVHIMHTPFNGQGERIFQTTDIKFPMRTWVKLTACLDFDADHGNIKVWQNDQLVSEAEIGKGRADGFLTQAHFGLYAPPSVSRVVVYNDYLIIKEGSCTR